MSLSVIRSRIPPASLLTHILSKQPPVVTIIMLMMAMSMVMLMPMVVPMAGRSPSSRKESNSAARGS